MTHPDKPTAVRELKFTVTFFASKPSRLPSGRANPFCNFRLNNNRSKGICGTIIEGEDGEARLYNVIKFIAAGTSDKTLYNALFGA